MQGQGSHETGSVRPFSAHRHRRGQASPQGVPGRPTGPGKDTPVDRSAGQAAQDALRRQPTRRSIAVRARPPRNCLPSFDWRYGRPGKGNDNGSVEGLVGYSRRNFMVPIPTFPTWDAFNDWLEDRCRRRQRDTLSGHGETIGAHLRRDLEAMAPLPATPFEACDQASGRVNSLALVRYKTNDYSVPVAYGHRDVWIRAYVDRVMVGCGYEVIARHARSYDREDMVFDPVHYLTGVVAEVLRRRIHNANPCG